MGYEYMGGLGAMVGPTSCPANQRLVKNLTAGTSRCVPLCSSYQCQSGKIKRTLTAYSAGAAQIRETTSRRQDWTRSGCVRVPATDCVPDSQMLNSAGVETYCCPDPDAQWRVQEELDLIRRRANRTTTPAGSSCGAGGVTKGHRVYSCPPSISCQAELRMPQGCVATGLWYDDYASEYCCPARSSEGPPESVSLPPAPPPPVSVVTTSQAPTRSGFGPLFWLGLGAVGVGLFLVLRKK